MECNDDFRRDGSLQADPLPRWPASYRMALSNGQSVRASADWPMAGSKKFSAYRRIRRLRPPANYLPPKARPWVSSVSIAAKRLASPTGQAMSYKFGKGLR
jgi:hypothetical protein